MNYVCEGYSRSVVTVTPVYLFIIIFIYFNCKWSFTRWQCYYNKTQHTNNTHHTKQHTTLKQNTTHKTTQTTYKGHTTHNEYNANTITTTMK
jgi:hypothetical protein